MPTTESEPESTGPWQNMVSRCTWSAHPNFHRYGGRGIRICQRWLRFENFLADMGNPPPRRSLDRINNDRNYTPKNCRWATRKQQQHNTSVIKLTTAKARRMRKRMLSGTLSQNAAAREYGVSRWVTFGIFHGKNWVSD